MNSFGMKTFGELNPGDPIGIIGVTNAYIANVKSIRTFYDDVVCIKYSDDDYCSYDFSRSVGDSVFECSNGLTYYADMDDFKEALHDKATELEECAASIRNLNDSIPPSDTSGR